jgi:Dienelactone hydrolase and related enzymes
MKRSFIVFMTASLVWAACNDQSGTESNTGADSMAASAATEPVKEVAIKEETVTYKGDGVTMKGFVAFDSLNTGKRPAVLIVHEWWGLNDYPRMRARELAKLGYVAFAMDMYGDGKTVDNPGDAEKMVTPFYQNPKKAKARMDAALATLKSMPQTDSANVAAIGYCFGGGMVINAARLGEDVKGVVSFHGSLLGTPAKKELLKAKILVCNGADDQFLPKAEIDQFKKQMDSIGADYTFKDYPGAGHAFTNPEATEVGKKFNIPIAYNAEADSASWSDMRAFFDGIFK